MGRQRAWLAVLTARRLTTSAAAVLMIMRYDVPQFARSHVNMGPRNGRARPTLITVDRRGDSCPMETGNEWRRGPPRDERGAFPPARRDENPWIPSPAEFGCRRVCR